MAWYFDIVIISKCYYYNIKIPCHNNLSGNKYKAAVTWLRQVVIFLLTFALNTNHLEINAVYTQQELLTLLKAKNENAFSYLYKNFSGALYSIILQIIPDQEQANHILRETFLYAGFKINEYDEKKGKLFTWMLHIARNLSIDVLRTTELQPFIHKEHVRIVWQDKMNKTGLKKHYCNYSLSRPIY